MALLPGCSGQKDHLLPEEAKKWILYEAGQPDLEFVDDQNQVKRIRVDYRGYKKEITKEI